MIIILTNGRSEHYGVLCSGPRKSISFNPLTSFWHPYETDSNFQMRKQRPWKLQWLAHSHRSGKWPRQDLKLQCDDTACDLLTTMQHCLLYKTAFGKMWSEGHSSFTQRCSWALSLMGWLLQDSSQLWGLEHFPKHLQKPFSFTQLPHCCTPCAVALSGCGPEGGVHSPRAYAPQVCWNFSLPPRPSTCCQVHQNHHLTETLQDTLGFPSPQWSLSTTPLLLPLLPHSPPQTNIYVTS